MQSRVLLNHSSLAVSPLGQVHRSSSQVNSKASRPSVSHICFQAELRTDTQWADALRGACISSAGCIYQPACDCLACVRKEKGWRPREGRGGQWFRPLGELRLPCDVSSIFRNLKRLPTPPIHLCRISLLVTVI